MRIRIHGLIGALLALSFHPVAGPALGQDFPSHSVRMIVPYRPGGITDITARIIAPGMNRLHAAAGKALQRPEVSKRLAAMGAEVVGSTPAQMESHLKGEMDRWVNLAREVKFEVAD